MAGITFIAGWNMFWFLAIANRRPSTNWQFVLHQVKRRPSTNWQFVLRCAASSYIVPQSRRLSVIVHPNRPEFAICNQPPQLKPLARTCQHCGLCGSALLRLNFRISRLALALSSSFANLECSGLAELWISPGKRDALRQILAWGLAFHTADNFLPSRIQSGTKFPALQRKVQNWNMGLPTSFYFFAVTASVHRFVQVSRCAGVCLWFEL